MRALATLWRFCHDQTLGRCITGLVTMGLERCLLACLLTLTGVGTAAAMDVDTQDPIAPHATLDSGSHEGGSDPSGANRGCPTADNASDNSGGSDGGSSGGGGGGDTTTRPRAGHQGSLGWQSLLPGSIQ
jgi:hypothetical protein